MAALPVTGRDIARIEPRDAVSSGPKFRNGDTLLARITPCLENGKGAKVSGIPGNGIAQGSTEFIVMRAKDVRDENFVYYLSRHPDFRRFAIQQMSGTSGRQRVAWQSLATYEIAALDIAVRERIGTVLAAIDDKIALNRQMNETLEASARALFRDWFVDFGPTRAKMAGLPAYMDRDLWFHFPDRLNDDGVPEGWEVRPLDQIAEFLNGLALQKYPPVIGEKNLPVIKIAELRSGISASSNRASAALPAKYIIEDGDFLFSWSGSLLAKFWTGGRGALNQHLFKVTSELYPAWFYTHWVWHHLVEFQMIAASKATTMGHIQRGHLSAATTICPPLSSLAVFGEVMHPLQQRLIDNLIESRTLAAIRDALLPKLMSGELRVRDAEALAA